MPTDIEIARSVTPLPITEVAKNAGVDVKHLIPYGFDKAKVDYSLLNEPTDHQAKLVLVTAINPTPAGEGKTTADLPYQTFDNGIATINTETCAALGLSLDTVKEAFKPYCTEVVEVETAENF